MKFLRLFGHVIIISILTALTQIGGLVWITALLTSFKFKKKKRYLFPVLYLAFNLIIIPPIAKALGREKLPVFAKTIKPRNLFYPLLFRNYVNPELKYLLEKSANQLKHSSIAITYLDANFPFIDGFPLLPHLSHNDGKKIDISFMYLDENGNSTNKKPSISGYGIFVNTDNKTANSCLGKGYWQYNFTKHLAFGTVNDLNFDKKNTQALIRELLNSNLTEKIFIEPYLKKLLNLTRENRIRFHGCKAVRHDDHIHLQIK